MSTQGPKEKFSMDQSCDGDEAFMPCGDDDCVNVNGDDCVSVDNDSVGDDCVNVNDSVDDDCYVVSPLWSEVLINAGDESCEGSDFGPVLQVVRGEFEGFLTTTFVTDDNCPAEGNQISLGLDDDNCEEK